jgi:hypothetical protein
MRVPAHCPAISDSTPPEMLNTLWDPQTLNMCSEPDAHAIYFLNGTHTVPAVELFSSKRSVESRPEVSTQRGAAYQRNAHVSAFNDSIFLSKGPIRRVSECPRYPGSRRSRLTALHSIGPYESTLTLRCGRSDVVARSN